MFRNFGSSMVLRWYSKNLETYPLITKCITSGIIAGSGDICCQYITSYNKITASTSTTSKTEIMQTNSDSLNSSNNNTSGTKIAGMNNESNNSNNNTTTKTTHGFFLQQLDIPRACRFTILGFILVAPTLHVWYGALARYITTTSSSLSSLWVVSMKRTFLDQTICAPIFLPIFMISLMILEGKRNTQGLLLKLKHDYFDLILMNWTIWIPAQIINFRLIPNNYTLLFSNCIGFVWNIYLSYKFTSDIETTPRTDTSTKTETCKK